MTRVVGLKAFLAALCLSAIAVDSASAQAAADAAQAPQSKADVAPDAGNETQPGWLLKGRGQNRIVNPFRTTPAPGTGPALQTPRQTSPLGLGSAQPGANAPASQVPANASANAAGQGGWTCLIGFRRQGAECVAVEIPPNATLDLTGHSWMCQRGFRRQGQGCVAFRVPENASLSPAGNAWVCNYGFRREAQSCVAVVVPEHASLDKAGRAWVCDAGYQRRGQVCIDDATARLQQQADRAVNARPGTAPAATPPSVTINSGENRQGRTSKAKVVIGRF